MSEFIKGKRYRFIDTKSTCWFISGKEPKIGDIAIFVNGYDSEGGIFKNPKETGKESYFMYSRFDPTPLPDPIEYMPEVVHCTWCGEPVLFPESHRYLCVHNDKPNYWMCQKELYLCDVCRGEDDTVDCIEHCYCSEHVEQHRPKSEIGLAKVYFDGIELQSTIQVVKHDEENGQENLSACPPVDIDDTANTGIAAVIFGSKPKQMYAEKTWKGPSNEELQKKANVEDERKRYE